MKLTLFSEILNHHIVALADYLYLYLGDDFRFVEVTQSQETKGSCVDFSKRKYLIRAWENSHGWSLGQRCAIDSDICIYDGYDTIPFQKKRLRSSKISFDVSERWLKKGLINILSPRLLETLIRYHFQYNKDSLYKLCASAYAANDQYLFHSYKDKCFKWGYFSEVSDLDIYDIINNRELELQKSDYVANIMWCGRFIYWKHPELAIMLVSYLKQKGINVRMDMYGIGEMLPNMRCLCEQLNLSNQIEFKGFCSNKIIREAMLKHDIFIFTSDRNEGWGVVLNEAMSSGCAVVVSDEVGAAPFLVEDCINGLMFKSGDVNSLVNSVLYLLSNQGIKNEISIKAYESMHNTWSPKIAAENLIHLSERLLLGKECDIQDGPCSKAFPLNTDIRLCKF